MPVSTYTLTSDVDGLPLSVLEVDPESAPVCVLQLTHGICEYKERYLPFMDYLAGRGVLCVLHDHRGHGKSLRGADDLGYFGKGGADAVVEDMHMITRALRGRYPDLPLVLLGHSMGSLAARVYLEKHDADIDGLILTGSPAERSGMAASLALLYTLRALRGERCRSRFVWAISTGNLLRKKKSPAYATPYTLNGNITLAKLMIRAYGLRAPRGNAALPVRFFSGDCDHYAPKPEQFTNAVEKLRAAGYADVRGQVFPGLHHDILVTDGSPEVYDRIFDESIRPLIKGKREP